MLPTTLSKSQTASPSPFSPRLNRPNVFNYDDYVLKKSDELSKYQSEYSKFNTSSDFIKTTFSILPNSPELINQIKLPIGINFSPLSSFVDGSTIPLCDYTESNEIPCCKNQKCKAYINPFIKFMHGSDQWQCNMCKTINKTLDYYYCAVDQNGVRLDQNTKAEFNNGTYEFVSYKDNWIKDRPQVTASFYFLIDVSQNAINSGFTQCVLETIKDIISNGYFYNYEDYNIKVCIITYDDQIHFYPINIKNENDQNVSMLTINESYDELFLPTNKDYLLVELKKYKDKLIQIIENIQNNFITNNNINAKEANKFFDVVKICNLISDKKAGKILIFNGSNVSGLKMMNGGNNTPENHTTNNKYGITDGGQIGKLGISLSLNGISVNIFQCCNTYTNLKTLNQLITNSNGNLFFYKNFNMDLHYKNIYNQIRKILTNENVFEGCLKIRFSHNFIIQDYVTPVLLYNKDLIFYPNLDSDQNYSLLLGLKTDEEGKDSTRIDDDFTYIQASLIYSKGDGYKRIRVFNLCIPVSSNPKMIYESVNSEVLSSFLAQYLIMKIFKSKNLGESVAELEKQFFQLNDAYFSNLNLIKKELDGEMRTVSLYFLGMLKNCLFNRNERGVNNDIDLSNYYRARMQKAKFDEIICFVYPRIYVLDNILELQGDEYPPIINDNKESLDNQGSIFLIDNGFELILYIRNYVDKNIIHNLFGVDNFNEINLENATESNVFDYDENKNDFKKKIMDIIDNIRGIKSLFQNLRFIFEGVNEGNIINDILIEDNNNKGYPFNYEKFYNKIIFDSVKY